MADTNASSKKHSRSKRSPTTPSVQENDVEATSQVELCARPCLNRLKSKQKSLEEDGPNGPCPGMSSDNQDARHVAHVGQDAGDAETNQLSRFRHLERMVKLIATHVGLSLGQDSDPICLDANDGSDPDWSPDPDDDDQDHVDITEVIPDPRPPQKRRKNKFLKKISSSTIKKPFHRVTAAAQFQKKSSGPRFHSRHVVFKSKFQGRSKNSLDHLQKTKSES